jgi:hypothetical protein
MRTAIFALVAVNCLMTISTLASGIPLGKLHDAYRLVCETLLTKDRLKGSTFSVGIDDRKDGDLKFRPFPDSLWSEIRERLVHAGADVSGYTSATNIVVDARGSYRTKDTGSRAWILRIQAVRIDPQGRLRISQGVFADGLTARGWTFVLQFSEGRWEIVARDSHWVS